MSDDDEQLADVDYEEQVESDPDDPDYKEVEEYDGGEAVHVDLGFTRGQRFSIFEEFSAAFEEACKTNYVRFSKRDSRTIEAAKRKVKQRSFKEELQYYHVRYVCFFSQKYRSKGTGKRKRTSLTQNILVPCPASIALRTTDCGQYLEIYDLENFHNHPVNEKEYQKFLPKSKTVRGLYTNPNIKVITEDYTEEDKYRTVLGKCKHIARLASVSSHERVNEILKSLDDFIYYLKYTASKQIGAEGTTKMETDKNAEQEEEEEEEYEIIEEEDE